MIYDGIVEEANKEGIEILETSFKGKGKGFCIDRTIFINDKLSDIEKNCIIAEELGHVYKTNGTITNQINTENRKQEIIARRWGYEKLISLTKLIEAFENGILTKYELAEYLEVTESFLLDAIYYYKQKYGVYIEFNNYIIYFEPSLGITKLI